MQGAKKDHDHSGELSWHGELRKLAQPADMVHDTVSKFAGG